MPIIKTEDQLSINAWCIAMLKQSLDRRGVKFQDKKYFLLHLHSEVAELSSLIRYGNGQSEKCPEITEEQEELADVILTCFAYAGVFGVDIETALKVKFNYNETREDWIQENQK